jgi:hypothetical protein
MDSLLFSHHHYVKRFLLIIAIISFAFNGFSQQADTTKTAKNTIICLCCGPTDPTKQPLWVINGKDKVQQSELGAIDPNYIKDLTILNGNDAQEKYGETAKNGVVEIELIKEVKINSVKKILAKHKIDALTNKLPIYLNDKFNVNGDTIFTISNKKIKVIVVQANINADNRIPSNDKYLSISQSN